ncbi:MAG: sigma-70 family RNA polymerase sigma factor [Phycisphaerales bacterium]|nr:sigma-70 family RNA polymerase sigma factor [Phycisphaerales bacterium]
MQPDSTNPDPTSDDWRLMQEVASGDERAVGELYDRFGALVYKSCRQVLYSAAESEDASQEVFVRLWRTADRFDPHRAKLVTWVMLITRRLLIDRLRKQTVRAERLGVDEIGIKLQDPNKTAKEQESSLEERAKLAHRLRDLPDLQRAVIERAYLHGFSLREIATQLETPLGTVKSALSRGLGKLRERALNDRGSGRV